MIFDGEKWVEDNILLGEETSVSLIDGTMSRLLKSPLLLRLNFKDNAIRWPSHI